MLVRVAHLWQRYSAKPRACSVTGNTGSVLMFPFVVHVKGTWRVERTSPGAVTMGLTTIFHGLLSSWKTIRSSRQVTVSSMPQMGKWPYVKLTTKTSASNNPIQPFTFYLGHVHIRSVLVGPVLVVVGPVLVVVGPVLVVVGPVLVVVGPVLVVVGPVLVVVGPVLVVVGPVLVVVGPVLVVVGPVLVVVGSMLVVVGPVLVVVGPVLVVVGPVLVVVGPVLVVVGSMQCWLWWDQCWLWWDQCPMLNSAQLDPSDGPWTHTSVRKFVFSR